jgi:hypothetical protein
MMAALVGGFGTREHVMGFLRRLLGGSPPTPTERQRLDLRAATLADGYERLIQGPMLDVVGESNYRAAIETVVGRRPEGHQDIVDAMLVWEPDNQFDPNAIAVQIGGRTCGYVPRPDAKRYRPVMEWCRTEGFVPVVRADVSGGWRLDDGSWAHFGIRLYVAMPDKLLGRPARAAPVPSREHPWVGQTIAFTGDSRFATDGEKLDRETSEAIARNAGMEVHARVTKKVRLLVDCDDRGVSGDQRKAIEYGIRVIREIDFWTALGLPVEPMT